MSGGPSAPQKQPPPARGLLHHCHAHLYCPLDIPSRLAFQKAFSGGKPRHQRATRIDRSPI